MTEQEEFEFRRRFELEQQAAAPTLRQKIQSSTPMRVIQGMRDSIDAGAQLLPRGLEQATSLFGMTPNPVSEFFGSEAARVDRGVAENERAYEQARKATAKGGDPGFDAARLVGNIVSPANAAVAAKLPVAASVGGRVLQGAGLGAAGGALTPVNTENNPDFAATKMGQMGLGAVTGAVATPILGKLTDYVGTKLANIKKPSDVVMQKTAQDFAAEAKLDWANMSQRERSELVNEVRKAAAANAGKDPAAALRAQDFKQEGMPYLLGQVTRDPTQFAREKNLSQIPGTGDPLTERLMQQGAMLREKVGRFGAGADTEQDAGAALAKALRSYDENLSKDVRGAYQAARQSAGKDAEIPMQGLAQDFAEVMDSFGDKIPSGVRNQFVKYGIAPGGDMTQRKLFTVEEADKLLKVINANQSNDPATNAALGALRASVKKSVTADAGADDVFAPARKAAAARFSLQDAVPALEASASGRVNPDTFVQQYVVSKTAQTQQVEEMARLLREGSPEAFDQAKSQVGAYLQRKAFGENQAGDKVFSPERFATALRELGPKKLEAFFSPDEVQQMQRLSRIGAYMESVPNASRPNSSGNWGAITGLAQRIPGAPTSLALASALKGGVSNHLDVAKSLSGKTPAKLSPEEVRLMAQILSQGGLASGAAVAGQLR